MIDGKTPVSEYMTPAPLCIDVELPVSDARARMANDGIRHLPVLEDGRLIGIISARDIVLAETLDGIDPVKTQIGAIIGGGLRTVSPTEEIGKVLSVMQDHHVGAVPVLDNGNLVGIFTDVDAVKVARKALA